MYEIVPVANSKPGEAMLNVVASFRDGNISTRAFEDSGKDFISSSADFKFAAAVAEFGMILRQSSYKGNGTLDAVLEWAQDGKGRDPNGYRAGFIELVRKTQQMMRG
jgi:Ca-activated chloride channel family protein